MHLQTPEYFVLQTADTTLKILESGLVRVGAQWRGFVAHPPFARLYFTQGGSGVVRCEGREYLLAPDTCCLVPGGKLLASFESGLNEAKTEFALPQLGVVLASKGAPTTRNAQTRGKVLPSNDTVDYLVAQDNFCPVIPRTEHVMYARGVAVEQTAGTCLAATVASYFDRDYLHFCSHRQTPSSGVVTTPGIVQTENTVYFAHPVFSIYNVRGPLWCKELVRSAVAKLLPTPVVSHNGPSTLFVSYNSQPQQNRTVLHLLHYIPERRCREIDLIEDIIPVYNIEVQLRAEQMPQQVYLVPQGTPLPFVQTTTGISLCVPEISGHQMVCVQFQ